MDPFAPIRATTLHPALVHFTLGVVPVILLAYGIAVARGSERWRFAGDVALWVGAASTLATVASGLVANALVPWPGGTATWRWMHLAAGVASAVVFLGIAVARLKAFRRGAPAGRGTLAAAVALSAMLGFTGWIGGEVLVFHSGIAVAAAGHGALAPTVSRARTPPRDLVEAMGRIRGAWAEATTAYDRMLVHHPTAEGYARVASAARDLRPLAEWLETAGPKEAARKGGPELAAIMEQLAGILRRRVEALEQAAAAARWTEVTQALGAVTSTCAGCHAAARWKNDPRHGADGPR